MVFVVDGGCKFCEITSSGLQDVNKLLTGLYITHGRTDGQPQTECLRRQSMRYNKYRGS